LNPDFRHARAVSSLWTMAPLASVDRMGVEPTTPTLQESVAPTEHASPILKRSVRESNPVPLLTEEVCCRNTYRPSSDPGWDRTSTLLHVTQASSPLDHGIMSVTEVGVEPTHHEALDLAALPICVPGRKWRSWCRPGSFTPTPTPNRTCKFPSIRLSK
jgi:hypothetical protein